MANDIIAIGMTSKVINQLADIVKQSAVTEATNTFTCNLSLRKNFSFSIGDTNSKTIAFSNMPADIDFASPIIVKVSTTAVAVVGTYPTGTVWQDGQAPVYAANKTYYLYFMRITNGWHAGYSGAW